MPKKSECQTFLVSGILGVRASENWSSIQMYSVLSLISLVFKWHLLNQLGMTYLFTKREHSLIFSALIKCTFVKSMLLPNFAFDVIYTGNKKITMKIVFP